MDLLPTINKSFQNSIVKGVNNKNKEYFRSSTKKDCMESNSKQRFETSPD